MFLDRISDWVGQSRIRTAEKRSHAMGNWHPRPHSSWILRARCVAAAGEQVIPWIKARQVSAPSTQPKQIWYTEVLWKARIGTSTVKVMRCCFSDFPFHFSAGLGNMVCGTGMQSCTLKAIWSTISGPVTFRKTGSSLMLQGRLVTLWVRLHSHSLQIDHSSTNETLTLVIHNFIVFRRKGNSTQVPTTWQIKFELQAVSPNGTYTLQLALASATYSRVQVGV